MITPRVLFRTHYQAVEPYYLELLVRECTSPVHSSYESVATNRLVQSLAPYRRLNRAAASYVVQLARSTELLASNLTWTPLGLLTALVSDLDSPDDPTVHDMTVESRLLWLRIFLEFDGAVICYLARRLLDQQDICTGGEPANQLSADMFLEIFQNYLQITTEPSQRVRLRNEMQRLSTKGYGGRTGNHKLLVHVQALYRLGFLTRPNIKMQRFTLTTTGRRYCERLLRAVPDISRLERIGEEESFLDLAGSILGFKKESDAVGSDEFLRDLARCYRTMMRLGLALCPLAALLERLQIGYWGKGKQLMMEEAKALLRKARATWPRDIRLHVDRRGRPSFLVMSRELMTHGGDDLEGHRG